MRQLLSKSKQLNSHNSFGFRSYNYYSYYLSHQLNKHNKRNFSLQPVSVGKPAPQYYAHSSLYQKPETDEERDLRVKQLFGDVPLSSLIEVTVDNKKVRVPSGVTVLQACEAAGVNIPRFCYHDRLSIAGNCRMCLVEVEKAKKPVASCANPIMPGMVIKTQTDMVKFAREGVVEFLLANHPLDCPICDQGGECDLQDISITFGSMDGRYLHEDKRGVEDKDLGPFIRTVMNRCIHCTRCIRFSDEIAGNDCLGTSGRGNITEVGTYIDQYFDSEISGNIIDLCPVGALTNKQSSFKVRPWDLTIFESIDIMESTCASIVLDTRFNELIRIKPRLNEDINEEWISDKSRFCCDGVKRQRLDIPLIKNDMGILTASTWPDSFNLINSVISSLDAFNRNNTMMGLCGDYCDIESMMSLRDFFNNLGCNNIESRMDNTLINCDLRNNYLFNTRIPAIELADTCLIIGCNPRMEAPLINTRLRKSYLNGLDIYYCGNDCNLNYDKEIIGNNLNDLYNNNNNNLNDCLDSSEYPLIIFGMSCLFPEHYSSTQLLINHLVNKYPRLVTHDWNGISFLQTRSGRNGALDIGCVNNNNNNIDYSSLKFVYCLGSDEYFNLNEIRRQSPDAFIVYQGSHGDNGARLADIVLPGCSWCEKNGTYVNIDGRVQRSKAALTPPGQARIDWQIIRALSEICNVNLKYDNINELRERIYDYAPHLQNIDKIEDNSLNLYLNLLDDNNDNDKQDDNELINITNKPFEKYFNNYFQTDPISRSSLILKKAIKDLPNSNNSWC